MDKMDEIDEMPKGSPVKEKINFADFMNKMDQNSQGYENNDDEDVVISIEN